MKNIRSGLFWIVGLTYFFLISIITIFLSYIFPLRSIDGFVRCCLRGLFKVLFIKVEVIGTEKLDKNKTYIFMANHASLFDVPLLKGFIPVYCKGVEAHHQFRWPIYGTLIKRLGTVPIERENIYASIRSIKKALKILQMGTSITILPEGHRTKTGELQEFKKLPFHLAKKSQVDIVPIGISGLYELKRKGSWHISPSKVTINFGDVITSKNITKLQIDYLRDKTSTSIKNLIVMS